MAFTPKQMAMLVASLGLVSFICGVFAEIKKPAAGTPIQGKGVVICKYSSDPTLVLGYISVVFLAASTAAGYLSLFYLYSGKSIPQSVAFHNGYFSAYFNIAMGTAGLALSLLLWPTVTEHVHHIRNIHHDLETECPTAKTGILGGGAFASLNASLFWLVALMLVTNVREDFFEDELKDIDSNVIMVD